jgi:hypothetical protein
VGKAYAASTEMEMNLCGQNNMYIPYNKEWIKKKAFAHLKKQAQ